MIQFEAKYRPFVQYLLAILLVGAALAAALVIPASLVPNPYLFFFLAVILSSWYGNFGTGLVTSVLSLLVMRQFGIYSTSTPIIDGIRTDITRFLIFVLVTGAIAIIQARHRRSTDALRRSRDQLDIYLRDMANGVLVQDRDGKLVYANYEAAKMLGFLSVDEMLRATRDQLLEGYELFDEFGEPFPISSLPGRLALLGMRYPETVLRFRYNNSTRERWAFDKARPVFDKDGNVQYSVSMFLDVTELKEAQQALEDQREQMRVTLRSIADAVIATDSGGRVTFLNPVASQLIGWPESSALNQPITTLFYGLDETTRKEIPNPVEEVLYTGKAVELQDTMAIVSKEGIERPIEASASPILDAQGQTIGAVLVFRDITRRRQVEANLRNRARQQDVVAALGLLALEQPDVPALMQTAVEKVAETLEVEYAKTLQRQPGGKTLLVYVGVGFEDGVVGKAAVEVSSNSQAGYTLVSKEPVISDDLRAETRFHAAPLLLDRHIVSSMSVIIPGEREPWGVLGAHTTQRRKFTEDDIHFMQAVANLLASSISRAQAAQAEREERVFAEALRDTAEILSSTLDLAQVLDRVLENVEKVVPHDAADIMLLEDDAARVVRYRGYAMDDTVSSLKDMRLSLTRTTTLRTMAQTLAPLIIDDTRDFPGWVKVPHMEWLRSYLAVPLVVQGSVKGFLNLTSVQPNFFNQQQAKRLQAFGVQVIAAIQNAQLYGEALRRADENTLREVAQELRRRI